MISIPVGYILYFVFDFPTSLLSFIYFFPAFVFPAFFYYFVWRSHVQSIKDNKARGHHDILPKCDLIFYAEQTLLSHSSPRPTT